MKGKRLSKEQIIYALKRVEGGEKAVEVCRQIWVSEAAFYQWKKRYAGLGVSELGRLRQLEDENQRLKGLVADLTLDKEILQEVLSKKSLRPVHKRELVKWARSPPYQPATRVRAFAVAAIELVLPGAAQRPSGTAHAAAGARWSARALRRRLHLLLRREGWKINAKRVYRLYRQEHLSVRTKTRRKHAVNSPVSVDRESAVI